MHALAEVFGSNNDTPLAKPRKEVLRERLYTALLRDLEPSHIERWHGLLHDLFNGNIKVKLTGRIVHVQHASVANSGQRTYVSAAGVPVRVDTLSAIDVDLVLKATKISPDTQVNLEAPSISNVGDGELLEKQAPGGPAGVASLTC